MKNNYYTTYSDIKIKYNRYAYRFSNIKIPHNIYVSYTHVIVQIDLK